MNQLANVVIIEDDADIRTLLEVVCEHAGFRPHAVDNGFEGIRAVNQLNPIVTTIDINMPGIDGIEVTKRIRATSNTYIVLISARTDEVDIVQGLQAGADDYLTKPFRPRELRARIEAMLRRPRPHGGMAAGTTAVEDTDVWFEHRGLHLNPAQRRVVVNSREVLLTRSEFDLLHALLSAGSRVCSKDELARRLHAVSPTESFVSSHDRRTVEVHLANLRKKIAESPHQPQWIETVRGVGYRLTAPAVQTHGLAASA